MSDVSLEDDETLEQGEGEATQEQEPAPVEPIDASNQLNSDGVPYGEPDDDGNVAVIASLCVVR